MCVCVCVCEWANPSQARSVFACTYPSVIRPPISYLSSTRALTRSRVAEIRAYPCSPYQMCLLYVHYKSIRTRAHTHTVPQTHRHTHTHSQIHAYIRSTTSCPPATVASVEHRFVESIIIWASVFFICVCASSVLRDQMEIICSVGRAERMGWWVGRSVSGDHFAKF